MNTISNELKTKLLAAKSAGEAAELIRAAGQEITAEDAARLWEEISHMRDQDGRELSLDELESVSGGSDRDWAKDGCAATVENGSWCDSNDMCFIWDVTYDHDPLKARCPNCGTPLYKSYALERGYPVMEEVVYKRCKNCGYKEFMYK